MEYVDDGDTNYNWCTCNDSQMLDKGGRRVRKVRASCDSSNYSIGEIGQNSGKSRGDLRRLAVTLTPVKGHPMILGVKTCKG